MLKSVGKIVVTLALLVCGFGQKVLQAEEPVVVPSVATAPVGDTDSTAEGAKVLESSALGEVYGQPLTISCDLKEAFPLLFKNNPCWSLSDFTVIDGYRGHW